MRAALIAAAKASSGYTSQLILASRVKAPSSIGGWNVDRKGKGNGRRNR